MSDTRKLAFYMPEDLIERMDKTRELMGKIPRAEFVREAVDFYIGFQHSKEVSSYLSPILARTIKSEIAGSEKSISELLFNLTVQCAMLSALTGVNKNYSARFYSLLEDSMKDYVSKTNGVLDLGEANKIFKNALINYKENNG